MGLYGYICELVSDPWLLIGDFNEVLLPSEVRGGHFVLSRAEKFATVLEQCGLLDLGATGNKYTWVRRAVGAHPISIRLDRALANCDWRTKFLEAYVENLCRLHSDHCPILLRCSSVVAERSTRPFRLQAAWINHEAFPQVVQRAWSKGNNMIYNCLEKVREDALVFNTDVFGNIFKRKRTLESRIKGIQRSLERADILSLVLLEADLRKEYNDVLKQEEMLWYPKSREKWVKMGDRNVKFFHTQTIVRRKRNIIHGLYIDNNVWCSD